MSKHCVFHWSTVFWNITSLWQRKIKCLYPRISNYHSPGSPGVSNRQTILLFNFPSQRPPAGKGKMTWTESKIQRIFMSVLSCHPHIYFAFCMGTKCGQIVLMVRRATCSVFLLTYIVGFWQPYCHWGELLLATDLASFPISYSGWRLVQMYHFPHMVGVWKL